MTLFFSALFPTIKLLMFSPFLAIVYPRFSIEKTVWIATGCGLILDLLCSELRFGIQAVTLAMTTLVLSKHKHHFFEDKPLSLCLSTLLISLTSTLIQWLLLPLSGFSFILSWTLVATDLILLPIADALYAFLCFYLPLLCWAHIQKMGWKKWSHHLYRRLCFWKEPLESSEEMSHETD